MAKKKTKTAPRKTKEVPKVVNQSFVVFGTNNPDRRYAPVLVLLLVLSVIQVLFVFPLLLINFVGMYAARPEFALGLLLVQVLLFIFLVGATSYAWYRYRNL